MRFFSACLFRSFPAIRRQKSVKPRKGPFSSRSLTRLAITGRPSPLTASSPNRMPSPWDRKAPSLQLTSGGSTWMPRFLHSSRYSMSFPVFSSTEVNSAARYCRG